jgi:hypothetical protein
MATLERRVAYLETSQANPRSVYQYSDSELEAVVQRAIPGVDLTTEHLAELAKRLPSKSAAHHEKS